MNERTKNALLLFLLASSWGPSFLLIKIALEGFPALTLTALRIGIGGIFLLTTLYAKGLRLPLNGSFWKKILISGFFGQGLPFTLINWGEQYVDSALASLINGLTPLFTILLAHLMLPNEKVTASKMTGIVLGFIGLFILVLPSFQSGAESTIYGIGAISVAAVSYGIALVYIKKHLTGFTSFQVPAAQLVLVSSLLLPISWWVEPSMNVSEIGIHSLYAVIALGLFGTGIAFIVYFKLLRRTNAGYVSMVTYITPVYGVVLGAFFLNEHLTIMMILGSIFILGGIYWANKKPGNKTRKFQDHLDTALYSKVR